MLSSNAVCRFRDVERRRGGSGGVGKSWTAGFVVGGSKMVAIIGVVG